jgi:hypothetical protein
LNHTRDRRITEGEEIRKERGKREGVKRKVEELINGEIQLRI